MTTLQYQSILNVVQKGFNSVGEFHELFEHPKEKYPKVNVFDENPKLVKLRLGLIQEEVKELSEAVEQKNIVEVADALSDILYVVFGAGQAFGINLVDEFDKLLKVLSNFDEVKKENFDFSSRKANLKLFEDNFVTVKNTINNLNKVVTNLENSLNSKDFFNTGSHLAIVMFKVYEIGKLFNINLEETFDLVHSSNMTKACSNEQDAKDTVADYLNDKEKRYKMPTYKLSNDKKYWIVYDGSTGKTLKSKYYKPVDLSYIAKN